MNLKHVLGAAAARLGYVITPIWRVDGLALELHLRELFAYYDIKTVLDVGANAGQYRNFLRQRVGFAGVIHSFEPQLHLASALAEAAEGDALWTVHNFALGSENAELTLNVTARDTFSSFKQPDNALAPQFETANVVVNTVTVPVRRLDDLTLTGPEGIYLKCDTQGFDLQVMYGARNLLARVRALQFELAIRPIYEGVPGFQIALDEVGNLGFDVSGFFPVSRDAHMRVVELDCVMVKRRVDLLPF